MSHNARKVVRLRANDGAAAETRKALIELRQDTLAEPGCDEFEFLQSLTDEGFFVLIEDFASPDALETHMQAAHTKRFFERGLLASGNPVTLDWLSSRQ
jgi:quinol monooxygenase YgiN